jgi:hypothetical protein
MKSGVSATVIGFRGAPYMYANGAYQSSGKRTGTPDPAAVFRG